MLPTTPSRRLAALAGLVLTPVLAGAAAVTQPNLTGSAAHQLGQLADAPLAGFSAAAFAISQLATLLAVLAIGRLLVDRAPRLSACGTALGVLGAFGHAVFGGVMIVWVILAGSADRSAATAAFHDLQSSPVMAFSLLGLAGTVLGIVLLGIGLFRAQVGPRWVGPALWAFVVVEFVGGAISSSASYASAILLLLAFGALARTVAEAPTPAVPATALA